MSKGGKQGEGREGSQSLCIFRSICASSGPELWALPHQMCVGFNSSNDSEPFPPERALSCSLVCPVSSLLRVAGKQEPACSARCGAPLEAAGLQVPHGNTEVTRVCSWFCSTSALGWCGLLKTKEKGWEPLAGHWARVRAGGTSLQLGKQLFH